MHGEGFSADLLVPFDDRALDLEVRKSDLECKGGARVKRCKVEVDACVTVCRQSAHRGLPRLRRLRNAQAHKREEAHIGSVRSYNLACVVG